MITFIGMGKRNLHPSHYHVIWVFAEYVSSIYGFLCAPNFYHQTKRGVITEILERERKQVQDEDGWLNIDGDQLKVSLILFLFFVFLQKPQHLNGGTTGKRHYWLIDQESSTLRLTDKFGDFFSIGLIKKLSVFIYIILYSLPAGLY